MVGRIPCAPDMLTETVFTFVHKCARRVSRVVLRTFEKTRIGLTYAVHAPLSRAARPVRASDPDLLIKRDLLCQRRIVRVPRGPRCVKRLRIRWVELGAFCESRRQVGIGQEGPTKCNSIGIA